MEKETRSYSEINDNGNNLCASVILSIIGRIIMILGGTAYMLGALIGLSLLYVGPGHGPANELNCNRELITPNDTDVVSPNADTLYCTAWMDLSKEPLVLKVPPIPADRYYTFEFLDAYTNVYAYVGTRATGSSGGTFLIAGPEWEGQVPEGMTKIWSQQILIGFFKGR